MTSILSVSLLLCLIGAALPACADMRLLPPGSKELPPRQSLAVEMQSRLVGADWTHRQLLVPARRPVGSPQIVSVETKVESGGCLNLILHFFDDGSVRPTGQVLDDHCQLALGDWQELKGDGGAAQFHALTTRGALEVRVSVRWVNLNREGLSALTRAELQSEPGLSPEQLLVQERQRRWMALGVQHEAVDRAWRAAKRAQ